MDGREDKLGLGIKINYGIGTIGATFSYGVAYSKASFYMLTVLGLSKKFFAPMFFLARIWDGFNDLIMLNREDAYAANQIEYRGVIGKRAAFDPRLRPADPG